MPRPFTRLTVDEFADLLDRFPFTRRITAVHLHHTWRPRQVDYRGLATIEGMWRFHTQENNWSDIAQHLTIDPEGGIWTGRSFNRPPVSAKGFNGVSSHGPFMIEMIGDFDEGRESFADAQKETALRVLALLHIRHGLHPETLCFHNHMSGKTCPGSSIAHDDLVAELEAEIEQVASAPRRAPRALPFGAGMTETAQRTESITRALLAGDSLPDDPADAELPEDAPLGGGARGGGKIELTAEILDALRPHIINLRQGDFSSGGHVETSKEDVDALVHEHLKSWYEEHGNLQLMLYAHGGLTSERSALTYAHQSFEFWKDNGVYPIFFIWETGLIETLGQMIRGAQERAGARRDLFDFTTDPVIENLVRALGGVVVWGGMKRSAERAGDDDGGGTYFVEQLRKFSKALDPKPGPKLGIHALGHSAGSIFHSHLLPQLFKANGPSLRSLHFLAPAVTVDLFKNKLSSHVGGRKKIRQMVIYTMRKKLERDDNVIKIYRKSLLYMIHRVLEPERMTPILGLEKSLRRDREMTELFGLAGSAGGGGEVVWSITDGDSGLHASRSRSHGGFNNDPPTMNSVLRRVLGLSDEDEIHDFKEYPAAEDGARGLGEESLADLLDPEALAALDIDETEPIASPAVTVAGPPSALASAPQAGAAPALRVTPSGRRRALCVGINDYPSAPLAGCVNDSRTWADAFRGQGFEVTSLTDGEATRDAILGQLESLVQTSRAGDVALFQYAGHGTQLPDLNKDEEDGQDEAFVPHDYEGGGFLLDDDLGKVWDAIPAGVNVTTFIDCCHSGTLNRVAPGGDLRAALHRGPVRSRFLPVSSEMNEAHRVFRSRLGLAAPRDERVKREVHFGACQDYQSAWESNGKGDFTTAAAPLLAQAVAGGWTHAQLEARIEAAFAGNPRQLPHLVVSEARRNDAVLASTATAAAPPSAPTAADPAQLQQLMQQLVELLSGR